MFESLHVDQVLRPFRKLKHLRAFAFPRNTDFRTVHDTTEIPWPPNLQQATFSGLFPSRPLFSKSFLKEWPSSLHHVVFDSAFGLHSLYNSCDINPDKPYTIFSVHFTDRNSLRRNENLVSNCSGVRLLSLPANLAITRFYYDWWLRPPVLERLEIRRTDNAEPHQFSPSNLWEHTAGIPFLLQIRVHGDLVDGEHMDFRAADTLLKSRAQVRKQQDGSMAIEPDEAGIKIFYDN